MVQVKKTHVRQSIVDSAFDLFSGRGYNRTTLQNFANVAGTGVGSVYSYFPSRRHLLYAVVEPW
jgi:AcrR family transcriptional regulator